MTDDKFAAMAEKIVRKLHSGCSPECETPEGEKVGFDEAAWVLEALRAVDKEARDKERESVVQYGKEQRWEARTAALEDAMEIASEHNGCVDTKCLSESNCGATISNEIYDRIRKLKGDLK